MNDGIDDDERGERFVAFDCVVAFAVYLPLGVVVAFGL